MSKIETIVKERLNDYGGNLGIAVMTLATVVGMLELTNRTTAANRFILPSQVVKVEAANELSDLNNPVRRESEETTQRFVSYSQSQRTPSRSETA